MNVADSEKLAGILSSAGYEAAENEDKADIILVNTCVVRKSAEDRATGYISTLKSLKEDNSQLRIGVCGCLVTEPGIEVKKLFPHVDLFIAPNQPEKLQEFISSSTKASLWSPFSIFDGEGKKRPSPRSGEGGPRAKRVEGEGLTKYLTIMQGCDNFCSYCIVPYVRGRESSRPIEEVINEILNIDFRKHPEIYLLGQNVNSYKYGFANLLRMIENNALSTEWRGGLPAGRQGPPAKAGVGEALPWIRFMTSHPRDMSDEIINTVAESHNVCEFFHLPIQHGDDEILKKMNRGYTIDYYRKLVDRIRARIPGVSITSDVIVGFPGETDDQFRRTLYIIEEIRFDAVNTLAYSVRPATAAAKLSDDVPQKVKDERLQEVMKVVEEVALLQNQKLVGTTQAVLVEGVSGRTRTNKIVKFASARNDLLGRVASVKINSARSWALEGEITNG